MLVPIILFYTSLLGIVSMVAIKAAKIKDMEEGHPKHASLIVYVEEILIKGLKAIWELVKKGLSLIVLLVVKIYVKINFFAKKHIQKTAVIKEETLKNPNVQKAMEKFRQFRLKLKMMAKKEKKKEEKRIINKQTTPTQEVGAPTETSEQTTQMPETETPAESPKHIRKENETETN